MRIRKPLQHPSAAELRNSYSQIFDLTLKYTIALINSAPARGITDLEREVHRVMEPFWALTMFRFTIHSKTREVVTGPLSLEEGFWMHELHRVFDALDPVIQKKLIKQGLEI